MLLLSEKKRSDGLLLRIVEVQTIQGVSDMLAVDVQHIQKHFKQQTALNDVTFSIKEREIFGFLGPSGAGKTTLIKLLTGQLSPDAGTGALLGHSLKDMTKPVMRQKIGVLSDNSGLYERLTIQENLVLYRDLYNLPKEAVDEALAFVNLSEHRKKRVTHLSKGMRQRVTLARTIMHKPKILFLDEPTSALDPANTAHIYRGLRALNEQGTTIFLTTHDMAEAENLCNRVAFLHDGLIQAIGTVEELKDQYREELIVVELEGGASHELALNGEETATKVSEWMRQGMIQRILTKEPTLGDIFMKVTGSDLI